MKIFCNVLQQVYINFILEAGHQPFCSKGLFLPVLFNAFRIVHYNGYGAVTGYNFTQKMFFPEDRFWLGITRYIVLYLGFHCLPKYPFRGFW